MILIGTSGYNYPEWKGSFYPSDLPASKMLPYYASKFPTVEINYTFYRMPTPKLIAGWRAQVPPTFRFTLKAPKRITHDKRLRAAEVADSLHAFITAASELGPQMAALLGHLSDRFGALSNPPFGHGGLNELLCRFHGNGPTVCRDTRSDTFAAQPVCAPRKAL